MCVCLCVCVCVSVCVCVCVVQMSLALLYCILCAGNLVNKIVGEMHMKVNGSCKEERIHFFSAVSARRCQHICPPHSASV